MGLEWLLKYRPIVYHVTYASNVESIRKYGFFSANDLKRKVAAKGGFRSVEQILCSDELGRVTLRDQDPMRPTVLSSCLRGMSPESWYEFVDSHIFFALNNRDVEKLLTKYKNQRVLEVSIHGLFRIAAMNAYVTPINSGAVGRANAKRGADTFHALETWVREGFTDKVRKGRRPPVELAFRQEHLQIDFVVRGEPRK
jgi:hypothetical protein